MRRLLAVAVIAMAMAVAWASQGAIAREGSLVPDPAKEEEFVAKINDLRAAQGLARLTVHGELAAKARDWAETMAEAGDIWHSNLPDGITVRWRRLGENVGTGGTVDALHQAFVDSPSHYENLVDPGFRYVGVGVFLDADETIFVSEVFMELASQPAPATPAPNTGTPTSPGATPAQPISNVKAGPGSPDGATTSGPGAVNEPSSRLVSVLGQLRALDA